jgi:hypothetical protein
MSEITLVTLGDFIWGRVHFLFSLNVSSRFYNPEHDLFINALDLKLM